MGGRFDRTDSDADSSRELSPDELERHNADALPDREALSILNADVGIPLDPALAADVLSGLTDGDEETPSGD